MPDLQARLKIAPDRLDAINEVILNPDHDALGSFVPEDLYYKA